jgi:phage/plasmid-like protein (TIGR03299 family)
MAVVETREMDKTSRVDSQMVMKGDIGAVYGGTVVDAPLSINDALVQAGLDWEVGVDKVRMAKKVGGKVIPGFFATYRTDTGDPLGVVKTRYVPMQNRDAFRPFERILGDAACIESAGALHGGRYTWLCIDLGSFDVLPDDQIKRHLLLINSHDGSSNILAQLMPNRLACQNMLNFSFGGGGGSEPFKIRHTGSAMIRLEEVRNIMSIANENFDKVKDAFMMMKDTKVTEEEHRGIVHASLGVTKEDLKKFFEGDYEKQPQWVNHAKEIDKVFEIGPGMDMPGLRGTVYGTLQAVTGYYDHFRHVRGSGDNPDNNIESKLMGHSAKMKTQAFKACVDFCKN